MDHAKGKDSLILDPVSPRHDGSFTNAIYADRNIRLLKVFPGEKSHPINCQLLEVALDDFPEYEAISYVWGDANIRTEIQCNRAPLAITANLAAALLRFRDSNTTRILWADAICINQMDIIERNCQVKLMGHIYSHARKVLVWLGEDEAPAASVVFGFIELAWSVLGHFAGCEDKGVYEALGRVSIEDVKMTKEFREAPYDTLFQEPLGRSFVNHISNRPWFTRIWCIQEVAVSQEAVLFCGERSVNWEHMNAVLLWLSKEEFRRHDIGGLEQLTRNENIMILCTDTFRGVLSVEDTLYYGKWWQGTDLRDKVYALLGILNEEDNVPSIEVDYTKSVQEVYRDTALCIIAQTKNLYIFVMVDHGAHLPTDSPFPSWVPQWDKTNDSGLIWDRVSKTPSACGGRDVAITFSDHRLLELEGVSFDSVEWTSERCLLESGRNSEKDAIISMFRSMFLLQLKELGRGHPDHHLLVQLTLTFTGGMTGYSPPHSYFAEGSESERSQFDVLVDYLELVLSGQAGESQEPDISERAELLVDTITKACRGRRIFGTSKGYLGLGPGCLQQGDIVVVLYGGTVPHVLRPMRGLEYAFVGSCFVYDIAQGQIFDKLEEKEAGIKEQAFRLI